MLDDRIEMDPRNKSHSTKRLKEYRIIGKKQLYNASNLTAREQMDASCSIHCFKDNDGYLRANHALKDCRLFNELSNRLQEEKQKQSKRTRGTTPTSAPSTEGYYPPSRGQINMIQEGFSSKKEEDANTLRAHDASTIEEPYYICDSDFSITFT